MSATTVVLESPYAAPEPAGLERNLTYARAALRDSLRRSEAPFASHLLYTQPGVLDDNNPEERLLGISAGFALSQSFVATAVYVDLGISEGMYLGIMDALRCRRFLFFRALSGFYTSFTYDLLNAPFPDPLDWDIPPVEERICPPFGGYKALPAAVFAGLEQRFGQSFLQLLNTPRNENNHLQN